MAETKGSGGTPKPGTPEWRDAIEKHDAEVQASGNDNQNFEIAPAREGGKVDSTVRAFGVWLRKAWTADLDSEPEPTMPALAAVAGGVA